MHLVVFDIDGTLTNTNLEDGEKAAGFCLGNVAARLLKDRVSSPPRRARRCSAIPS